MALGIINKLTNFLMPVEEDADPEIPEFADRDTRVNLQVHSQAGLKMYIGAPLSFDDVQVLADYLRIRTAVLVNLENVDSPTRRRIHDFLDGVCAVTGGSSQKVADHVLLFTPPHVAVNHQPYVYNLPVYQKRS